MKAWYFVALSIVLFGVAILGLRHNDLTSRNMKARLIEKDRAGENVQQDREELKQFVFTHMNASRRVVLRGAYQRARAEAQAEADRSIDGSVYEQAQSACDREGQRTTENAECVQNYVQQRLDDSGAEIDMPSEDQFTYVFYSPPWAPDIAGISIVGGVLSLIIAGVVYARYWLNSLKKKHT